MIHQRVGIPPPISLEESTGGKDLKLKNKHKMENDNTANQLQGLMSQTEGPIPDDGCLPFSERHKTTSGKRSTIIRIIDNAVAYKLGKSKVDMVITHNDSERPVKYSLRLSAHLFNMLRTEVLDSTGPVSLKEIETLTLNINQFVSVKVTIGLACYGEYNIDTEFEESMVSELKSSEDCITRLSRDVRHVHQENSNLRIQKAELTKRMANDQVVYVKEIATLKAELRSYKAKTKKK